MLLGGPKFVVLVAQLASELASQTILEVVLNTSGRLVQR
jgi:hypothetical protein